MFLSGQLSPLPRGRCPSVPKIFVTYTRAQSMRNNNQILNGDYTIDVMKILHGRPRMLTRDLFAVAITSCRTESGKRCYMQVLTTFFKYVA